MDAFSHLTFAVKSDIGRKRKNNEDSFGTFPGVGVFCVADGMGGGDDGEVASAATVRAIETFSRECPLPQGATYCQTDIISRLRSHLNSASSWIFERAKTKHLKGCGSTFVGVCFDASRPEMATALHAGDSRLYRIRGRSIQQITKDHSAAELIGAKDESELNPMFRGMILRAVGIQPSVEVETTTLPLKEGDKILICSDGLCRMVSDKKMLAIVRENDTVAGAVDALITAANSAGGVDNITVELIAVGRLPSALPLIAMPEDAPQERTTATTSLTDAATQDTDSEGGISFEPASADSGGGQVSSEIEAEETCATQTIPEEVARVSFSPKFMISAVVVLALAIFGTMVGVLLRNRTIEREAAEAERQAEVACAAEEVCKAELIRKEKETAERREAERKAEEDRIRIEAENRRAEELLRQEQECKEREESLRLEKLRLEREKRETERKIAEQLAREEAERERQRIVAENAAKELARQKAEAERRQKAAEEQAANAAREAAIARAAAMERRRIEALSAFEEVCEQDVAVAFVRKVSGIIDKDLPDDLCTRFKPLTRLSELPREQKLAAAVALTKDVKIIVARLMDYARVYLKDVEDQLMDSLTTPEYRKELKDVPKRMSEFLEHAQSVVNGDPSDPEVQFKCVLMIHSIPSWF